MRDYLIQHLTSGKISEISMAICDFFQVPDIKRVRIEDKLDALCHVAAITRTEMDQMISKNSPSIRTIKGHVFEIVFAKILQLNDIPFEEIGGDTDVDYRIFDRTLQLKTPYVNGCTETSYSYKTHKTHGAKSETESLDYYHRVEDFADYLVGLISYDPFRMFIIPKSDLPRLERNDMFIASPFSIELSETTYINNFKQMGINDDIIYPTIINIGNNEYLPQTAGVIGVRSSYIIDAIFKPENFRVWDMNLRGFIREQHVKSILNAHHIPTFDPRIHLAIRPEKVDLLLRHMDSRFVRFQIKGLTYNDCTFDGLQSKICCETQLSRGRVNDHPTQSRLYLTTDFDYVLVAMDPIYTNRFNKECYNEDKYEWTYYSIPVGELRVHHHFPNRLASTQKILYTDLSQYRVNEEWFKQWEHDQGVTG